MSQQNKKLVTVIDGYWFFFEQDGAKIAVHGSAVSGKESVYIDDELISEKRSLGITSIHIFKINEVTYKVCFKVTSILRGEVECNLFKEDTLITTESKAYYQKNSKTLLLTYLFHGFVIGISTTYIILTILK